MIDISNEEITNKMFFIREENSNQPIAVIKVGDLMKFERPQGEWICTVRSRFPQYEPDEYRCSICNGKGYKLDKFCKNCGAKMEVEP